MTAAAMDVLPLASAVENDDVDVRPPGSAEMNGDMSTLVIARPSSLCTDAIPADVTKNSRPSVAV